MTNPGNLITLTSSSSSSSSIEVTEGGSSGSQSRPIAIRRPTAIRHPPDSLLPRGDPDVFVGDFHEYVPLLGRGYRLLDQITSSEPTGDEGVSPSQ